MIFHSQNERKKDGVFILPANARALSHPCLDTTITHELWQNFSFKTSALTSAPCEEYAFLIGEAEKLPLDGHAYTINITPNGICLHASGKRDLLHAFMTLLDLIKVTEKNDTLVAEISCREQKETPAIPTRMVHYCVFPETELYELQRFLRLCAALKYTHVIVEFWGTLKYSCHNSLAWSHAFDKNTIRPIFDEARTLGLEIVPMFNHWGHASASRVMHGKHVVLDQDPSMQPYFSEDGWCWDIQKPKVKALLREIRHELIELCGEGDYFHIGCDEAYNFDLSTKAGMDTICDFINEISGELKALGRRAIAWGDMLLYRHAHYNPQNKYCCNAPTPEAERYMLEHLSRDVVIADWQYEPEVAPVETASVFKSAGFDCLLCPWDLGMAPMSAVMETVKSEQLTGFIHTTWHTLSTGMPYVAIAAVMGYESTPCDKRALRTATAALLRRLMPTDGNYERTGFSRHQIDFKW